MTSASDRPKKPEMFSAADTGQLSTTAREKLRAIVSRIESLSDDKAAIGDDIKAVFAEAKALGYDTKALRRVIALRKIDAKERDEQQAMLELYLDALGEL